MLIGDFICSTSSYKPSLIIKEEEERILITIDEYNGDYKWIKKYEADKIILNPEEELSLVLKYGEWFYNMHENIMQEIIIKNLNYYFKK
jgi:hypothetical protein